MNQLSGLMDNIMAVQIIDIVIAVSIVILLEFLALVCHIFVLKCLNLKLETKGK